MKGMDWRKRALASWGGSAEEENGKFRAVALSQYLSDHLEIVDYSALDNDRAGRGGKGIDDCSTKTLPLRRFHPRKVATISYCNTWNFQPE